MCTDDLWISSVMILLQEISSHMKSICNGSKISSQMVFRPFLIVGTDEIHRWSVDLVCVTCTLSVLIVDACPQIICGSCLCCFSFLMYRTIRRDEIHRSSVDLVCVFLRPYRDFLVDIHRSSVAVDVAKKIITDKFRLCRLFCVVTDEFCLW